MPEKYKLLNRRHLTYTFRTNVVMNYTEVEGKVREATNDEPWGPTGPLMQELAHATFTYEHFPEVMSMLWKRMLQDNKTNWRRTYKVSSFSRNSVKKKYFSSGCFPKTFILKSIFVIFLTEFIAIKLFGTKWFRACSDIIKRTHL